MAMNLANAESEVATTIATEMGNTYGDGDPTDYQEFADTMAKALMALLQHILDNAETSVDAESIL